MYFIDNNLVDDKDQQNTGQSHKRNVSTRLVIRFFVLSELL